MAGSGVHTRQVKGVSLVNKSVVFSTSPAVNGWASGKAKLRSDIE